MLLTTLWQIKGVGPSHFEALLCATDHIIANSDLVELPLGTKYVIAACRLLLARSLYLRFGKEEFTDILRVFDYWHLPISYVTNNGSRRNYLKQLTTAINRDQSGVFFPDMPLVIDTGTRFLPGIVQWPFTEPSIREVIARTDREKMILPNIMLVTSEEHI